MKIVISVLLLFFFSSCITAMKLSVPAVFKEQATEFHVSGSHKNKMTLGSYATSKIKRGRHIRYPRGERSFLAEDTLLSQLEWFLQEHIVKASSKFTYMLTGAGNTAEIFGEEKELTRSIGFPMANSNSLVNGFEYLQEYKYIFTTWIKMDGDATTNTWQLLMSNIYERQKDSVKSIFKYIGRDDNGIATNGTDTIYIKPVSLKNAETPNGKKTKLPVKLLSGYELSTKDGVIAIIDLLGSNVWLYNELNKKECLLMASITTALFARRERNAVTVIFK